MSSMLPLGLALEAIPVASALLCRLANYGISLPSFPCASPSSDALGVSSVGECGVLMTLLFVRCSYDAIVTCIHGSSRWLSRGFNA
jgi:hypothetical protein